MSTDTAKTSASAFASASLTHRSPLSILATVVGRTYFKPLRCSSFDSSAWDHPRRPRSCLTRSRNRFSAWRSRPDALTNLLAGAALLAAQGH